MSINILNHALAKKDWDRAYENLTQLEVGERNYITHNPDKWGTPLSNYHDLLIEVEPNTTYTFTDYSTVAVEGITVDGKLVEKGETYTFEPAPSGKIHIFVLEEDFKERLGTIFRFKLEKGSKATEWTPAPEDLKAHPFVVKLAELSYKVNNQLLN